MIMGSFHFLRPEWLLALIPAAVLIAAAFRRTQQSGRSEWAGLVDAHLLSSLAISGQGAQRARWMSRAFAVGLLSAVLGMAGPTWLKVPTPTWQGGTPSVIVLSLAQSMNGTDLVPSRLSRAGHKLRDILDRSHGDDTGLVIYSDRPFVAAPLTDDSAVIHQMLPELSTSLMPVLGNRLDLAIDEATALLQRAGAPSGRIVVLADDAGQDEGASLAAVRRARAAGYSVNVLGVGTEAGARLQTAEGRAIQTETGQDVRVELDTDALVALAEAGGGTYAPISATDRDLDTVFPDLGDRMNTAGDRSDRTSDTWLDLGFLGLLIPVLLAPLAFRRGLLMVLLAGGLWAGLQPTGAQAGIWADFWQTRDQQAQQAFDHGDFDAAVDLFTSPERAGGAYYRAGQFGPAAEAFAAESYNQATALAKSGALEDALAAYDAYLAAAPDDADAQFNRDIVAALLEQQQQQQDQQQSDQDDPSQQNDGKQDPQQGQDGQPSDENSGGGEPSEGQPQDADGQPASEQDDNDDGDQQDPDAEPDQDGAESEPADPPGQPEETDTDEAGDEQPMEDTFSDQMDAQLDVGDPANPAEASQGNTSGAAVLDQAAEQQLRRVPDDPSGLLRARIRDHYSRLRGTRQ
ncbi:VWA domain-containing protein [Pseudoruegeria sp. SK021]|uniref:VWA domain-containing protein n=1 Tax=Pseudoruegeria sp. SK021 TaxID=1933035 RepID=UPI000A234F3A|nr:VWA domain-containing protein [Pseudoruegeria sp. SK021]OSP55971.1 hypothetical protein BV911_04805 [Pseudoruegeria sp. SK021]